MGQMKMSIGETYEYVDITQKSRMQFLCLCKKMSDNTLLFLRLSSRFFCRKMNHLI